LVIVTMVYAKLGSRRVTFAGIPRWNLKRKYRLESRETSPRTDCIIAILVSGEAPMTPLRDWSIDGSKPCCVKRPVFKGG